MQKTISIKELETVMATKSGEYDAESADSYGFSVCMLCTGAHFEKTMAGKEEYVSMILVCKCGEIQIATNIIEEIYMEDKDGTVTLVFKMELPDLIIRYRE